MSNFSSECRNSESKTKSCQSKVSSMRRKLAWYRTISALWVGWKQLFNNNRKPNPDETVLFLTQPSRLELLHCYEVITLFFAVGFYTLISNYLFLSYFHADSVKTKPTQEYVMEVFFSFHLFLGLFTQFRVIFTQFSVKTTYTWVKFTQISSNWTYSGMSLEGFVFTTFWVHFTQV